VFKSESCLHLQSKKNPDPDIQNFSNLEMIKRSYITSTYMYIRQTLPATLKYRRGSKALVRWIYQNRDCGIISALISSCKCISMSRNCSEKVGVTIFNNDDKVLGQVV